MKYKNQLTKALLKEFRMFQKYAGKDMYSMKGNQEETFNNAIQKIIQEYRGYNK